MMRKEFNPKLKHLIAYDLETTPIKAGETPRPLYLTAYGEFWQCSAPIASSVHLRDLLETRFLVEEHNGFRFVAWNGNGFDVYLIALALLESDRYTLRPYLTRSKNLRGLKVIERKKTPDPKGRLRFRSWEFLDGIAMTGLVGTTLKKFLTQFAPDFGKLESPNFDGGETFNPKNPDHVRYAERDSEGLYHAMRNVERIVFDTFGMRLQPTVGNLGIKIFQANMPVSATVWKPSLPALDAIRNQVLRGGYCVTQRRYNGPVWKYDINQAYAAAMRDARLPAGTSYWMPPVKWQPAERSRAINPYAKTFIVRCRGKLRKGNTVPFYVRDMEGKSVFAVDELPETWITSIEYAQLIAEGARLEVLESYFWDEHFTMKAFVDRLEHLRMNAEGGPSGPLGTVVKMIGNNAYGKTVERLDGLEIVMALECPEGYSNYQSEETDTENFIWYRFADPVMREYHQPQVGAFITAQVRMVLRRAILKAPDAWIASDTDSCTFSRAVDLPIDAKKYGLWKIEETGAGYWFIDKKVYARHDGEVKHAKGMNVKRLKAADFEAWFNGAPPTQRQTHRQNFVKFLAGGAMFTERDRVGSKISAKSLAKAEKRA